MIIWLYKLESDTDYHNIIDFLKKFDDINALFFYIVDGSVNLKDGRIFGDSKRKNILLDFSTHFLYFKKKNEDTSHMHPAIEFYSIKDDDKINSNALIRLTDLSDNEIDKSHDSECYIRKGKTFIIEEELIEHLKEINFKFLDNSTVTKYKYILGY